MRIRALPISEWSTGEVCGHVCKRGSRDRRVSGICVVSTLAVCVRSSLMEPQNAWGCEGVRRCRR